MTNLKPDRQDNRHHLLPVSVLFEVQKAFAHGAQKYEVWNWTKASQEHDDPVRVYAAAMQSHVGRFIDPTEPDIDDDSKLCHLTLGVASGMIALWHWLRRSASSNASSSEAGETSPNVSVKPSVLNEMPIYEGENTPIDHQLEHFGLILPNVGRHVQVRNVLGKTYTGVVKRIFRHNGGIILEGPRSGLLASEDNDEGFSVYANADDEENCSKFDSHQRRISWKYLD